MRAPRIELAAAQVDIGMLQQALVESDQRNRELESKVEQLEADTDLIRQQLKNTGLELEKQKD